MPADRLLRILTRLAADDGSGATTRLCAVCAEITEMSGAGIMLLAGDRPRGSVCTTDEVSAQIEELQYTLGEGPCVDAHRQHAPVLEPDLASPAVVQVGGRSRAPPWRPERGRCSGSRSPSVRSVSVPSTCIATGPGRSPPINMPTPWSWRRSRRARSSRCKPTPFPASSAPELEAGGNFRFVVHQAAGMVAVQLGVPVDEALLRIRAHAFSTEETVVETAEAVIDRRLRFDPDDSSSE